jgi:hypothetical protein
VPTNQNGKVAFASLRCERFDNGKADFGFDCNVQTKNKLIKLHLLAN